MNSTKRETRLVTNTTVVMILISMTFLILAGVSYAGARYVVPEEDPYAPIYADYYGNEELVAVFFYRNPDCVPEDFDLWGVIFDIPAAFYCPLTVRGFDIYENPGDPVPKHAKLRGLGAVPVWFVSAEDFENALSNDTLTIAELKAMESLEVGYASFYQEVLHPMGTSKMPMKIIEASGTLEEGGSFIVNSVWVGYWPTPVHSHLTILFK